MWGMYVVYLIWLDWFLGGGLSITTEIDVVHQIWWWYGARYDGDVVVDDNIYDGDGVVFSAPVTVMIRGLMWDYIYIYYMPWI